MPFAGVTSTGGHKDALSGRHWFSYSRDGCVAVEHRYI
jgi:hypothetical protein